MRRINISGEAYLLHGLRFSGYLETLTGILADGHTVVDCHNNAIYQRPLKTADIALDRAYYQIFTDFYEQGGDLALSEPGELWDLLSQVHEFYVHRDLCHRADIIERWNNVWKTLINYDYFADNKMPELMLAPKGNGFAWRVICNKRKFYSWSSREFVKSLNIDVCPYCNMNPLPMCSIRKGEGVYHMHPDMDHYFDKGRYPFLALNIYNFIPACDICNRRIKGAREIDYSLMAHPYVDDVHEQVVVRANDAVVENPYINNIPDDWLLKDGRDDGTKARRGLRWFDFFGIMDLCKNPHTKTTLLRAVRNAAMKIKLRQFYREQYGGFMTNEQFEVQSYGCSLNPDEINKRPLSKITIDLVAQVEEYKRLGRLVLQSGENAKER